MESHCFCISGIPAVLWGRLPEDKTGKLIIAVHGNMSHKADAAIRILAEEAAGAGYSVLSFDLPEHGDRRDEGVPCKVQNAVRDLGAVYEYAAGVADELSLFACSMGAYFSLLAYRNCHFKQALFLSPVVDMQALIGNLMHSFGITEEKLEYEKEITTPAGLTLYWDYYCYVRDNPVSEWEMETSILCGENDDVCGPEIRDGFAERFGCAQTVLENAEHYFHTEEHLDSLRKWLKQNIA